MSLEQSFALKTSRENCVCGQCLERKKRAKRKPRPCDTFEECDYLLAPVEDFVFGLIKRIKGLVKKEGTVRKDVKEQETVLPEKTDAVVSAPESTHPEAKTIMVYLHGGPRQVYLDSSPKDLADLLYLMQEVDAQAGRDFKETDFYPIAAPEYDAMSDEERITANTEITERIVELTAATMAGLKTKDGRPRWDDVVAATNEGAAQEFFTTEDAIGVASAIRGFLDPSDPDFMSAVSDVQCGIIAILRKIIRHINMFDCPRQAFEYLQKLAQEHEFVDRNGNSRAVARLSEIPWELDEDELEQRGVYGRDRKSIVRRRLEFIHKDFEGYDFAVKNERLIAEIIKPKFANGSFAEVERVIMTFCEAAVRLGCSYYQTQQWLFVLLNDIAVFPQMTREALGAFRRLCAVFGQVREKKQLAAAIDVFKKSVATLMIKTDASKTPVSDPQAGGGAVTV